MRFSVFILALLAAASVASTAAARGPFPAECGRFATDQGLPNDFAPRLARLCVRLIEADGSAAGLDPEEREAAMRLGTYLAIVGELDLRKGFVRGGLRSGGITETSRYLIADRMGLLDMADRLAPAPEETLALR